MHDPTCPFCQTPLSEHPANGCLAAWAHALRRKLNVAEWRLGSVAAPCLVRGDHDDYQLVPRYPEDIAAAFELVKAAYEDGYTTFLLGIYGWPVAVVDLMCPHGPCERHGTTTNDCHGSVDVEGSTPAHAITKAYIAAKTQEQDDG